MKYYSTILNQLFDTPQACTKAEDAHKKAVEEKELAAKLVETKEKEFKEALKAYTEKYGHYHSCSCKGECKCDEVDEFITELLNTLFK